MGSKRGRCGEAQESVPKRGERRQLKPRGKERTWGIGFLLKREPNGDDRREGGMEGGKGGGGRKEEVFGRGWFERYRLPKRKRRSDFAIVCCCPSSARDFDRSAFSDAELQLR